MPLLKWDNIPSEALVLCWEGWAGLTSSAHCMWGHVGWRAGGQSNQNRLGHTSSCCFVKQMRLSAADGGPTHRLGQAGQRSTPPSHSYSPTLSALSASQMLTLKSSYPASSRRPERDGAREVTPHMMLESW